MEAGANMEDAPSHVRRASANRVKNKAPAKVQITAEQLLREAWERKESKPAAIPKLQIADQEELQDFQREERKMFEMRIVRNRSHTPLWIRYARWEEEQDEFIRARSIWERAIDNDYRNPVIWLNYAEMEMRHRFVNHARNIFDRAVALLPRVDQIWLKYAHMEEMLDRIDMARLVYERWLRWFPESMAYFAAIRLELRQGHAARARNIYEQLLSTHPSAQSYIKFAKFEEKHQEYARSRNVYERATETLANDQMTVGLLISFAKFEERRKQPDRARAIYQFALKKFPKEEHQELRRAFTSFEKQQGDRHTLESLLKTERRSALEATLEANPTDYDSWFDLIQMLETAESFEIVKQMYEKAIANKPPAVSKASWSRYIYLWLHYAAWTELNSDVSHALSIFERCVSAIPDQHKKFSFGKLWLQYAHAQLRNGNVSKARSVFGTGIGVLPKKALLYNSYIEMEFALGEVDRAREIYQVWLSRDPSNISAFFGMVELELQLGETERAIRILEVAKDVPGIEKEDEIWNNLAYTISSSIDFDEAVRKFEAYVTEKPVLRVWLAYVRMLEVSQAAEGAVRRVFQRGAESLRDAAVAAAAESQNEREDALEWSEKWLLWERELHDDAPTMDGEEHEDVKRVLNTMPKRIDREVPVFDDEGSVLRHMTRSRIVFPEEDLEKATVGKRLLEAARLWKLNQAGPGK